MYSRLQKNWPFGQFTLNSVFGVILTFQISNMENFYILRTLMAWEITRYTQLFPKLYLPLMVFSKT